MVDRNKYFCLHCFKSGKSESWNCGTQGHKRIIVSHKIHFPSPKDSKTRWKEFIEAVHLMQWGSFRTEEHRTLFWKTFKRIIK